MTEAREATLAQERYPRFDVAESGMAFVVNGTTMDVIWKRGDMAIGLMFRDGLLRGTLQVLSREQFERATSDALAAPDAAAARLGTAQELTDTLLQQLHREADAAFYQARNDALRMVFGVVAADECGEAAWAETVRSFLCQAGVLSVEVLGSPGEVHFDCGELVCGDEDEEHDTHSADIENVTCLTCLRTAWTERAQLGHAPDAAPPQEESIVSRAGWLRLLDENIDWAKAQLRTLERDHVVAMLEWARDHREAFESAPDAAGRVEPFSPPSEATNGQDSIANPLWQPQKEEYARRLAAVPAAAPPLALEWTDEQLRHAIEMADPTEWANGDRVYRLTNADCDAMRAVLTQAAQAGGK